MKEWIDIKTYNLALFYLPSSTETYLTFYEMILHIFPSSMWPETIAKREEKSNEGIKK